MQVEAGAVSDDTAKADSSAPVPARPPPRRKRSSPIRAPIRRSRSAYARSSKRAASRCCVTSRIRCRARRWQRLQSLIASADAIVFVLSRRSVESKVCRDEVAYGEELKKRIFPAVIEDVDWASVPPGLAARHSVFFKDEAQRSASLDQLTQALLTDIDWIREHTRLYERAALWQRQGRGSTSCCRAARCRRPSNGCRRSRRHQRRRRRCISNTSRPGATRRQGGAPR